MSDFTHDSFHHLFSERILNTPRSFIREMLTVTQNSDIISFAGGLPEPTLFPVEEIALAAQTALSEEGSRALQYSTRERPYFLSIRPIWGRFTPLLCQHLRFARQRFSPMGQSSRLWREV